MAALIAVGSVECVLTSSQQLVASLLLLPVLENTPENTPVEGLTGRQARAGETVENCSQASSFFRLRCFQAPVLFRPGAPRVSCRVVVV
jgi:hypothetical protein